MKLIIIRHGEPDNPNNTLTSHGFIEAKALAKYLKDVKFDGNKIARKSKLKIIFENDYKIEFDAACNKYFCINEIEE